MKTLSRILGGLLVALTIAIPVSQFTGCAILGGGDTPQLQRVITGSKIAAYIGTSEYLRQNPDKAERFAAVGRSLWTLEQAETFDAATFLAVVNQLPIKELKSPRAQIIITAATIVLTDYAGSLPVEQFNNLKPVAKAIREGIELGLPPQ